MLLGSLSIVGIGMMAAILPLLYVERGDQMTFVLNSLLLLFSGVYYSIEILPPWMQTVAHFVPGTYILDGIRQSLIDGVPLTALFQDVWPLIVMAVILIPARGVGVLAGRAIRQAHRQAEESWIKTCIEISRPAVQP